MGRFDGRIIAYSYTVPLHSEPSLRYESRAPPCFLRWCQPHTPKRCCACAGRGTYPFQTYPLGAPRKRIYVAHRPNHQRELNQSLFSEPIQKILNFHKDSRKEHFFKRLHRNRPNNCFLHKVITVPFSFLW